MTEGKEKEPQGLTYAADVREQKIPLAGPEFAERIRQFLAQHEVDTVIYVPEEGWVYFRKRAMAVEQKHFATSAEVPDNVVPIDDGKKEGKEEPNGEGEPTAT
jgi:hypothetical protein